MNTPTPIIEGAKHHNKQVKKANAKERAKQKRLATRAKARAIADVLIDHQNAMRFRVWLDEAARAIGLRKFFSRKTRKGRRNLRKIEVMLPLVNR